MRGFVRTEEEVRNIENFLAPSRFVGEELVVDFETTWEFARENLPPVFEPIGDKAAGTAKAYAEIAQFDGAYCGPMDCAIVALHATYEGVEGFWHLIQLISGELPVIIGRELWGETKKFGTSRIYKDGVSFFGTSERLGHTVFELEAEITGEEQAPKVVNTHGFDIKMFPGSNGSGLEYPPRLNIWDVGLDYSTYRVGTGSITWGAAPWDPVWSIPISSTGDAHYANYAITNPLGRQIDLEDPDNVYSRFLWGRSYDDPTLYPITKRWRGQDQLNQPPVLPAP
ncbi:acetoacetate decarboxylase family protein [Nocardia jiangxiensis]|uniref:Acetoacetate decarboxylase family protein n=1 Tax=Nocardia jiangxiensis TaxID=282685 RepID=A0ABW6SDV3_9NOCA|nr:acetoacetate decarboxylase family protein [Nocardia jiangxiensis]